jgi:altronate dehydratase small subunit
MEATERRILVLAPEDNVAVACCDLAAGETVVIDGRPVTLDRDIPTGHKLARRAIAAGGTVLKYGAPIGSARAAIAPGSYVHTHNLKSDYIPTWDREGKEMG